MLLKIKFLQQCCSLNDNSIKPRIETKRDKVEYDIKTKVI